MTSPFRLATNASLVLLVLLGSLLWSGTELEVCGQESTVAAVASGSAIEVRVGIRGVYRPGNWTAVRVVDLSKLSGRSAFVDIGAAETLDGDGVRVRYQQAGGKEKTWAYAVPGTASAPLAIFADTSGSGVESSSDQQSIVNSRFPVGAIEPSKPWVVVIGDPLGIETIGKNELLGRESSVATSIIESADDLPDALAGWEGVDLLVINQSGAAILSEMAEPQIATIQAWIRGGGRLFVSLGKGGGAFLKALPWLASLTAVAPDADAIRIDPAALETFTSSQTRLAQLDGVELPETGGRTLIFGRTASRQPVRLATEHLVGLGRVGVTSFSLDAPELIAWPQRLSLVTRLHQGLLDGDTEKRRESRTITAVPYDDLAGQLRASLDRFDSHRRIAFSIVSLILLTLAALIGPLDYWLINRLLGKPLIGWISFPLSVVAIAAVVVSLAGSRPVTATSAAGAESSGDVSGTAATNGLRSNRVEIVDISAVGDQPVGRAMSLTHVSSPTATRVDLPIFVSANWSPERGASLVDVVLTRPYGYSSPTFGGISIVGEDRGMPSYQIQVKAVSDRAGSATVNELAASPLAFPIAPVGSKGFQSAWAFKPTLGKIDGLAQRRGNELLTGSITNPLNVDILDGAVIYGNWVYLLPTRFRAGQTIESIESLRQKNFRWHLTRREALENASRLETWDVEMHDDLARLTEVLMFESSVGGRDYTGLSNRAFGGLDLHYALFLGQAILYGRFAEPIFDTGLPAERPSVSAVRVVLPVGPPAVKK